MKTSQRESCSKSRKLSIYVSVYLPLLDHKIDESIKMFSHFQIIKKEKMLKQSVNDPNQS